MVTTSNPDSRPLPEGWITQYVLSIALACDGADEVVSRFNEDHKTWFYVNKNAPGGAKSQWTQ